MRTYIIRAFLPWLIFLAFADGSVMGLEIASVGGALTLLLFNRRALKEKFLFDWASIIFFIIMWGAGVELGKSSLVTYSLLIAYLFLSLVSFMTLWLKVPIALLHAKSQVAVEYWNHPLFTGVGYWITFFWGVIFLIAAMSVGLFYLHIGSKLLMISIIPVILLVSGIIFTALFPDHYKKKVIHGDSVAALKGLSGVNTVNIGSIRMGYRTIGQGPLLILIYGARMNMHHWDPDLLKALSQHYEVLIFDYPGVGYSTYQQMPFTAKQIARCLKEMIDALALKPKAIVGYSMGGFIAEEFAIQNPEMTKNLILISTNAGGSSVIHHRGPSFKELKFTGATKEDYPIVVKNYFPEAMHSRMMKKIESIYDGAVLEGAIAEDIVQKEIELLESFYLDDSVSEKLKNLSIPALIIAGKLDQRIDIQNAYHLKSILKNSKLVEYENAGHGVIYQYPRDVAEAIYEFLNNVKS